MIKDNELKELFDSINTTFDDNDEFLEALNKRLEKVEYIRCMQDDLNRHYKLSVLYALLIGILVGSSSMALLYNFPLWQSNLLSALPAIPLRCLGDNPTMVLSMFFAFTLGTGAFWLTRNLQEIRQMRQTICLKSKN